MRLKYAVVYERSPNNFSAYVPELPGCISTGHTLDEIRDMIREAITSHIEDLTEKGEPVPGPRMSIGDAMAHHVASLSKAGEPVPELETTFGVVEVEPAVDHSPAARA